VDRTIREVAFNFSKTAWAPLLRRKRSRLRQDRTWLKFSGLAQWYRFGRYHNFVAATTSLT